MLVFGTICIWLSLSCLLVSVVAYLLPAKDKDALDTPRRVGRTAYFVGAAGLLAAFADLGILLVAHRFDCAYVYQYSAKAMDKLYWFPSLWAGQQGSFLLWAFWTAILGGVLALTSAGYERRVMPVYNAVLLFLVTMLALKSPFLPLDTHGGPVPVEGLGLNPNLENPWMVIHPPTLFLGFSSLAAPFAFGLCALVAKDRDEWLRRARPWALFSFSVLGLAMMMGGYWAYEMLGWGGFWGWDPVENGPLIPWLFLMGFVHSAQVYSVRRGLGPTTYLFAILPFLSGLYETFLTRSGVLENFSVHSFSTLGGAGNAVLMWVLIGAASISVILLLWRARLLGGVKDVWESPATREFALTMAVVIITICALISTLGMSAPLLTGFAMKIGLTHHVATIKEDYYNWATYPVALLLAIGMSLGPSLLWKGPGKPDLSRLLWHYVAAVVGAVLFIEAAKTYGAAVTGKFLAAQLVLFTVCLFALFTNGELLVKRLGRRTVTNVWTAGGIVSHVGAAILLVGISVLVAFYHKDPDVVLEQGSTVPVLGGDYSMTYLGQSGDYKTDRNNVLRFDVRSRDGHEHFVARLPFALRSIEGGMKKIIAHPSIVHHAGGDLYIALKDGPEPAFKSPQYTMNVPLGGSQKLGNRYQVALVRFDRDPALAAQVAATQQMPAVFPVTAVVVVNYQGHTTIVRPQMIYHNDLDIPNSPEVKMPGGWVMAFSAMNAGSVAPDGQPGAENATLLLRQDIPPTETFELEVTTRPGIYLVWLGTLTVVFGGLLSMRRRMRELRTVPATPSAETEPGPVSPASDRRNRQGRRRSEVVAATATQNPVKAPARRRS